MDVFTRRSSRLNVDIVINGQAKGYVPSYTTFDKIEGEVILLADKDTRFDHVFITFEGGTKVTLMRQSPVTQMSNNLCAFHPFLKLRQPIDPSSYPESREFKSQQEYRFPFTFVVPDRLLPQACSHEANDVHIKAAHTQLPPTLGDAMVCYDRKALLDDMAPIMSEIAYKIKVSVVKRRDEPSTTAGSKFDTLSSTAKKIRIVPATSEQPPLEVQYNCTDDYHTRSEKRVRKKIFGSKTGRLTVTAAQPKPLQLPARGIKTESSVNSHVRLQVRFDPEKQDDQPPQLRSLHSKLKTSTYYSVKPLASFPSKNIALAYNNQTQGLYTETLGLSSLCLVSAQWQKHPGDSSEDSKRSSLESTPSEDSFVQRLPSPPYPGRPFYTASILVPISLPSYKAFVPTFHSCLISRIYTLDLSLKYPSSNTSKLLTPSISLHVPIQITSASGDGVPPIDDWTTSTMLPETPIEEEYYRPRSILPPSEHSSRSSSVANVQEDGPPASPSYYDGHAPAAAAAPAAAVATDVAPPEYSAVPPSTVRTSIPLARTWPFSNV